MKHIPIATHILLIFIAILLLVIFVAKRIAAAEKKNPELAAFVVAILEDAKRISKEWNLGALCFTESYCHNNCFLLSFELGQDDLDKIETILHYEQDGGWKVIHPDYSALPILAKEFVINHKISRKSFYTLVETTIAKTYPEWRLITNNSVRIICF